MYITNKITKAYRRANGGFIDNIVKGILLEGYYKGDWFIASKVGGVAKSGWYIPGVDVDSYDDSPPPIDPPVEPPINGFPYKYIKASQDGVTWFDYILEE